MGSLGTGEILLIVLVAMIVFGPERLPEIARKAGELLAKAREMSRAVTDTIDAEYGDIAAPIKELKGEYDATMSEMKGVAASIPDMSVDLPEIGWKPEGNRKQTPDVAEIPDDPQPPASDEEAS
ncbi:MAG: twin-arginine translocase TatA/TatE family subunit [Acidimicrobiia bacterium]|nr:twin-arginine translocase TatA/TatE family subunit [Acidimicrobiia bacterium]